MPNSTLKKTLLGALLGAILGAAVAVLFAFNTLRADGSLPTERSEVPVSVIARPASPPVPTEVKGEESALIVSAFRGIMGAVFGVIAGSITAFCLAVQKQRKSSPPIDPGGAN